MKYGKKHTKKRSPEGLAVLGYRGVSNTLKLTEQTYTNLTL